MPNPERAAPSIAITKAKADSPWLPISSNPKIVENQCGSSDMIQSTEANVVVRQ